MAYPEFIKKIFWQFPFLSESQKEKAYYNAKKILRNETGTIDNSNKNHINELYRKQILSIPTMKDSMSYREITTEKYVRNIHDPKLIAYYLPQMHPTPENDAWWGKGVTEWNNVARAVPQYVGHYQPRLPGELGFYDLRLRDNILRQIELAQLYGIYAFCWYYYWFDGKRLLDKPLDMYMEEKNIDFPFCLCWANESWTKGFFGSSKEIIMKQNTSIESYKNFIGDVIKYLKDKRYMTINHKKVLLIYKPQEIPDCKNTIHYWREFCRNNGVGEIYIIGCWTSNQNRNFINDGFDAVSEFQPGAILPYCTKINGRISFVNESYSGAIYSYKDIVDNEIYKINFSQEKMYNAVMPMWDNTPRRNNKGSVIFDGANPHLYKQWLSNIVQNNKHRKNLDDNLIFINAWNEWGEGAYLEPDKKYGYAYLQATKEAIEECRDK